MNNFLSVELKALKLLRKSMQKLNLRKAIDRMSGYFVNSFCVEVSVVRHSFHLENSIRVYSIQKCTEYRPPFWGIKCILGHSSEFRGRPVIEASPYLIILSPRDNRTLNG